MKPALRQRGQSNTFALISPFSVLVHAYIGLIPPPHKDQFNPGNEAVLVQEALPFSRKAGHRSGEALSHKLDVIIGNKLINTANDPSYRSTGLEGTP